MFLRSSNVCRLCGARKSLRFNRNPEFWRGFQRGRSPENVDLYQSQQRSFSEKFRDPKNFRWVTGRPDDPPRKNRPKMTGRPEETCVRKTPSQDQKPVPNVRASDVTNPEKWTGRPESTCDINHKRDSNQKRPSSPNPAERTKVDHDKPKKGGKASFSGSPKEAAKSNSSGMSALQVSCTKRPTSPEVMPTILEAVRPLNQRQPPPCLEGPKIAKEDDHFEPSAASVFATQFNVAHQGMPEIVSDYARSVNFSEDLNTIKRPECSKIPVAALEKLSKLTEVVNASNDQTSPPPSKIAASKTIETSSNKFHELPEVKLSGSGLKNHLLGMQKFTDRPEKPGSGKRVDIKISKLPPLKIVANTFNEENRHRVYSFGLAETGALGFHKPNEGRRWRKYMARPLRHQFAEENRVISAESGYGFTLFYVKSDSSPIKLYGCGINTDFQLGPTDDEVVTYPSPIDLRISSPKTKIVSFSAGRAHTVVATDKEGVFLFGSNSYGQCGRLIEEEENSNGCTITQIKGLGGEKVATVVCGQDHTCFVTESGKVYACGWGSEGQTGQGHCMHVAEPCIVTGDIGTEKIVKIAGKCDTVLALSDKGNLFGWGSNEFKQLRDDPDVAQVETPVALEHVHWKCGKIIDIAAGSSFCLVLNQEGDVYVWGYGILGAGPELVKTSVPTLLSRTLFGANDYHPLTVPKKVYCGVDHMAVVNSLKHVYAWGKNKHGCLGIGNARDQYFPYKLAIGADAVHVSCAVDHSVVVTDHE